MIKHLRDPTGLSGDLSLKPRSQYQSITTICLSDSRRCYTWFWSQQAPHICAHSDTYTNKEKNKNQT